MADIFNMTDTWNDGSTDFDAIKMAVTDTASGANSNIINCTIDGGHALKLTKNKQLLLDGGSLTNLPFSFNSDSDTGIYNSLADQLAIVTGNSLTAVFTSGNLQLRNNSGGLFFGAATDARLNYEGADHLSLRRGLNAQSFSIYNTYTSSSVYERLRMYWNSNIAYISTEHSGASNRALAIDASTFRVFVIGVEKLRVSSLYNQSYVTHVMSQSVDFVEMTAPSGESNRAKIYAEDNGSGKTRLMVQFGTGAAQQIAIEP